MAEALFGWGRQTVALAGGETNRDYCLGAQSAFSGTNAGRAASAGSPSAASTRRGHAQQDQRSHELELHAADGPSGLEGAQEQEKGETNCPRPVPWPRS